MDMIHRMNDADDDDDDDETSYDYGDSYDEDDEEVTEEEDEEQAQVMEEGDDGVDEEDLEGRAGYDKIGEEPMGLEFVYVEGEVANGPDLEQFVQYGMGVERIDEEMEDGMIPGLP